MLRVIKSNRSTYNIVHVSCALILFEILFLYFHRNDALIDCSHTLIVHGCTTKRRGWKCTWISWHAVGDLVSSFAYANSGIRAGHVAACSIGGPLPHGSALLSSRAGYCRRNTSEQSTILPEIWRVLRVSVGRPRLPNSPDFFPVASSNLIKSFVLFLCFLDEFYKSS